jgi:glycosyltransferase involved in cell wall biosynthesis
MSKALGSVDVVVPVFNGRATIEAALRSVLAQEGDLLNEIIVVDDGSTDGSAEVVAAIGSDKIRLFRTSNHGVASARNLAIERSTAEWIAFLDADDLWEKNKLKAQIQTAADTGAGFICGTVNDQPISRSRPISAFSLWRGNFVATSAVLVQRKILLQSAPVFSTGMAFAEDYLAWLKCLTLTPGYYMSANLATYILSARPRYNWRLILKNLVLLNMSFTIFVWRTHSALAKKILLPVSLLAGSAISIFSIVKRFMRSHHA